MSGFIDWVRGVKDDEPVVTTERKERTPEFSKIGDENFDENFKVTEELWDLFEQYDRHWTDITEARQLLIGNPLAELERSTLEKREEELAQFWDEQIKKMNDETKAHIEELRKFMGAIIDIPEEDDEEPSCESDVPKELAEESFRDVEGIPEDAPIEDIPGDDIYDDPDDSDYCGA